MKPPQNGSTQINATRLDVVKISRSVGIRSRTTQMAG